MEGLGELKTSLHVLEMENTSLVSQSKQIREEIADMQREATVLEGKDCTESVLLDEGPKKEIMQLQQQLVEGAATVQVGASMLASASVICSIAVEIIVMVMTMLFHSAYVGTGFAEAHPIG